MTFRAAAWLIVGVVLVTAAASIPFALQRAQSGVNGRVPAAIRTPGSTTTTAVPSPDLVGETLAGAERAPKMGQPELWTAISVATVDPAVAPETIVAESDTRLTIAVPSDATCTRTQLEVTYGWSEGAMGSLYAGIVVRNVSSTWCSLPGPLHLVGLSRPGQAVTTTLTVAFANPEANVLSPDAPPASEPPSVTGVGPARFPIDVVYAYLGFGGLESVCYPVSATLSTPRTSEPHVAPTAWQVSVPGVFSITTANGTPVVAAKSPPTTYAVRMASPFWSCGGHITRAASEFA